jgi:hypothetical protein
VDPAGEPLLGGGDMIGRVVEENEPRVMPGELWSWVEATPGEPTGSSGKGLISVSGIAAALATSLNTMAVAYEDQRQVLCLHEVLWLHRQLSIEHTVISVPSDNQLLGFLGSAGLPPRSCRSQNTSTLR